MSNAYPYQEWESPCGPPGDHFLNQLSTRGYYKTLPEEEDEGCTEGDVERTSGSRAKVYAVVNITNIQSIDLSSETFVCRLRLYLMWSIDSEADGVELFKKYQHTARESGHYYSLADHEVVELMENITMPTIQFLNAT